MAVPCNNRFTTRTRVSEMDLWRLMDLAARRNLPGSTRAGLLVDVKSGGSGMEIYDL